MKSQQFKNKYVVRIDQGEEIVQSLKNFCREKEIKLGSITGIGAAEKIVLGYFNLETREYFPKEYSESYEITSLVGNISEKDGEAYLHFHANIAGKNGQVFGGHLTQAVVSATFEGVIETMDGRAGRKMDEATGLNLLDI